MNCPICQHPDSRVLRTDSDGESIRRRRQCCRCRHRWNSVELMEPRAQLLDELLTRLKPVQEILP